MGDEHARDQRPRRCRGVLRALFGWETGAFRPGVSLFRLSGYAGGEPHQPVPRDVVAAMIVDDRHAAWTVDVWVRDPDPQGAVLSVSQLLAAA